MLANQMGLRLILSLTDFQGSLGTGKNGFEPYLMWVRGSVNITGEPFWPGAEASSAWEWVGDNGGCSVVGGGVNRNGRILVAGGWERWSWAQPRRVLGNKGTPRHPQWPL